MTTIRQRSPLRLGALLGLSALLFSALLGVPALADQGGSGSTTPGTGGGNAGGNEYRFWAFDNGSPNNNVLTMNGGVFDWPQWQRQGGTPQGQARTPIVEACDDAYRNAIAEHGGVRADYRIVLAGGYIGNATAGSGKVWYSGFPPESLLTHLNNQWPSLATGLNAITQAGNPPHRPNAATAAEISAYKNLIKGLAQDATSGRSPQICVVLKASQPGNPPPAPEPKPDPGPPTPDKVWVLDQDGALEFTDPTWTNTVGADEGTFLHGDSVAAVVNGRLPKEGLTSYTIADDWTGAASHVDFSDASLARVFVDGEDATDQFTITVEGTTTIATAQSSILSTGNVARDRDVKLVLFGSFKALNPATDTKGASIKLLNTGWEKWDDDKKPTNEPPVYIWNPSPNKEDLNTDLEDIDGKAVLEGDTILYRLTLDAQVEGLTSTVHKLGMVDDFDEEYLRLDANDIRVTEKATGIDVTNKFNIQVTGGVAYIFAKHVLPDDSQPTDLAAYAATSVTDESPQIDQGLVGQQYWITLPTTVIKTLDGYVIENSAQQSLNNDNYQTIVVTNPLHDISPDKDVVVTPETGQDSIDTAEIGMNELFNYRLNSSSIPAGRAYQATQWSITDAFDPVHDFYTGTWAVHAGEDIYEGSSVRWAEGQLIESATAPAGMFDVVFDEDTYTVHVEARADFLDVINSRGDKSASFSLYTQMERIAPSGRIENTFTESYNDREQDSNIVWTNTPEAPEISLVKFDVESGVEDGDRNTREEALEFDGQVEIGFLFTNTGNVPLTNLELVDETTEGSGVTTNLSCDVDLDGYELPVGESVTCTATLEGVEPGTYHANNATVTGQSVFTGEKVTDSDPWNGLELNSGAGGGGAGALEATGVNVYAAIITAVGLVLAGVALTVRQQSRRV